jgi:preprotein translocase subunit SecF
MQLIGETNIDFMRRRGIFLALSAILLVVSVFTLATRGITQGVEFAGGAEVILRYVDAPELDEVRAQLADAGLSGVSVTTFGETEGREIVVRVALPEGAEEEAGRDLARSVVEALRPASVSEQTAAGKLDVNTVASQTLADALVANTELDEAEALQAAEALAEYRREHSGVIESVDRVTALPGVPDAADGWLQDNAFAGPFGLRGQEIIGAQISGEMRQKAYWAISGALFFMLLYIWIRFQLQYGVAAIIALVHDTTIVLGAFSLAGLEANLPVVAAFLTLVGYSVNDTIVVFDRIRENLTTRGTGKLFDVVNQSINQCLSRTVITSLTTWVVVACMFFLGGPVIRPFAFVLIVGIVVGTYSSIYVASPMLLFWQRLFAGRSRRARKAGESRVAARG